MRLLSFCLVSVVVFLICIFVLLAVFPREQSSNKLDKIYYINLDRRPDRNQHFLSQCQKEKIDMGLVQRFRAIDGNTLELKPEEKELFAPCQYRDSPYSKNIMANQLSHYYILQDMIKNDYDYVLILQDDVVFKKGFNAHIKKVLSMLPKDAEIVNIGYHQFALFAHFEPISLEDTGKNKTSCKRHVNETICEINDDVNPCSLAYIVTRKGAARLTRYFQTNGFRSETDWNYNNYLKEKKINYGSTIALCTGALLGSDIFTEK